MKEVEIQNRKIVWRDIQSHVYLTGRAYREARRQEQEYLKKIGPIIRRHLPTMHYQVLKMRCDGHTLEEVGKKFGVTRERIRQIEAKTADLLTPPTEGKE